MSGIAGLFYRNNKPVHLEQLQAMGKALAHRGPDRISFFCYNSIGLVHCMLYDTPESLLETLPHKIADKRLVITCHGRIDNRRELSEYLGWRKPLLETTDSELILAAYDKWGNSCAGRLLGDFAFAIWDERAQKLFCARDHMGVKPFYYYLSDTFFVFASEIKGFLSLKEVPRSLNNERVADFLTNVVTEKEATFYNDILRLSPAHYLEVDRHKSSLNCYYNLEPQELECKNRNEYEEKFREIFMDAVRCRVRTAFPVGSYLSGGLDSASIVCTAAGALKDELSCKIRTYSGIFETVAECDERNYFKAVLKRYDLPHHHLRADLLHPGKAFDELISIADEPPFSPHFFMKWNLSCAAHLEGMRIMLDGHDGDSAVSYGLGLFRELALQGNIRGLLREYRDFSPSSNTILHIKKIFKLYCNIGRDSIPFCSCIQREKRRFKKSFEILNPVFALKTDINKRLLDIISHQPIQGLTEQQFHKRNVSHPLQPYMLEFLERLGSRFSLVLRFPFFDIRVINFCLALPCKEKFSQGYNRSIVRRSLAEYLPKEISERKTKTDFSPNLIFAFSVIGRDWLANSLDNLSPSTYTCVNKEYLKNSVSCFLKASNKLRQVYLYPVIRIISLDKWLKKNSLYL